MLSGDIKVKDLIRALNKCDRNAYVLVGQENDGSGYVDAVSDKVVHVYMERENG